MCVSGEREGRPDVNFEWTLNKNKRWVALRYNTHTLNFLDLKAPAISCRMGVCLFFSYDTLVQFHVPELALRMSTWPKTTNKVECHLLQVLIGNSAWNEHVLNGCILDKREKAEPYHGSLRSIESRWGNLNYESVASNIMVTYIDAAQYAFKSIIRAASMGDQIGRLFETQSRHTW